MIKFKKALSILIVIIIIFSVGCSKQNKENKITPMGRYVEEEIETNEEIKKEGISKIMTNKEGEVEILVGSNGGDNYIYKLNQDNTIDENKTELIHFDEEKKYALDYLYGNDQSVYVLSLYDKGTPKDAPGTIDTEYSILKSSDKKNFTKINIPDLDAVNENGFNLFFPSNIYVLENGNIFIGTYRDELYLYNGTDGSKIRQYSGVSRDFDIYENTVVMPNQEMTKLLFYDIETGDVLKEISTDKIEESYCVKFDNEGNLYFLNQKGLYRIVSGGSQLELIIDAELNSMGMPSLTPQKLVIGNNNDYYVYYYSSESDKIFHYTYDENMPTVPNTELSIYSLWENKTIRQAIIEFQKQNPEVKVNYRIAMTDRHATTMPEHVKALNTELLNKKGADILVLDKLLVDTYVEKGMLKDMSSFLKPMMESNMFLNNIIEPYYNDNKIYAVPARFSVPIFLGKKDEINSIKTLSDLANYAQNSEIPILKEYTYSGRIEELFPYYSQEIINNKEINKEKLIEFLNNIKKINISCNDIEEMKKNEFYNSSPFDVHDEETKLTLMNLNSFMFDIVFIASYMNSDSEIGIIPVNSGYIPSNIVGINYSTQKQELAEKFVSVLLSEKIQDIDLSDGFPVNKKSVENWTKVKKKISVAYSDKEGNVLTAVWPKEEDLIKFISILDKYDTPIKVDYTLEEMIIDEFIPFVKGEKSAEQAADAIEQTAKSYLSE